MKILLRRNLVLLLLALISFISCNPDSNIYSEEINKHRIQKDSLFEIQDESPLDSVSIVDFSGLKYFGIDENYRFEVDVILAEESKEFEMKTSTDRLPVYRKYCDIEFMIDERELKLEVYQNVDLIKKEEYKDYLFLPFTDETSGVESYGGGRYIDLRIPEGNKMLIDFNMSYNPYCNYNDRYSCPVPPPQNHIPVQIKAGEKYFH